VPATFGEVPPRPSRCSPWVGEPLQASARRIAGRAFERCTDLTRWGSMRARRIAITKSSPRALHGRRKPPTPPDMIGGPPSGMKQRERGPRRPW